MDGFHGVEATIRYLTTDEGGRQTPVASGYRGQFHYEGEEEQPWDGFQFFPDLRETDSVQLGIPVRAFVEFPTDCWERYHSKRIGVGMPFQIREGKKLVGTGTVTGLLAGDTQT